MESNAAGLVLRPALKTGFSEMGWGSTPLLSAIKGKNMSETFIISDTHFGHTGVCHFLRNDGTKLRPWDNPDDMDEVMIQRWNETVKPNDKVYHLGDVVINRKSLSTLYRLNGDKVLIKGNHDIFKLQDYTNHFRDIRAYHVVHNIIFSHIPVHAGSKGRFKANIHGHLHSNRVMFEGNKTIDPWYFCACVEHTDYKPIALDDILKQLQLTS
jgi:calcineurin-like phosphoesterase family protein